MICLCFKEHRKETRERWRGERGAVRIPNIWLRAQLQLTLPSDDDTESNPILEIHRINKEEGDGAGKLMSVAGFIYSRPWARDLAYQNLIYLHDNPIAITSSCIISCCLVNHPVPQWLPVLWVDGAQLGSSHVGPLMWLPSDGSWGWSHPNAHLGWTPSGFFFF